MHRRPKRVAGFDTFFRPAPLRWEACAAQVGSLRQNPTSLRRQGQDITALGKFRQISVEGILIAFRHMNESVSHLQVPLSGDAFDLFQIDDE